MEQDDAPLAAALGGDQGRAVAQPGPAALRQPGGGFGQHLAFDADLGRDRQAGEGRIFREGCQALRLLPGQAAAQRAFGAQLHRQKRIRPLGDAGAGETQQRAPSLHPGRQRLFLPPRRHRAVGQHQHGNGARQQAVQRAAADFREGRQRPVEVEHVADQRRVAALLSAGQQAHGAAAEPFVQQCHGGRPRLVLDFQPDHLVADFQRQFERRRGLGGAGREGQRRTGQRPAIGGAGQHGRLCGDGQGGLSHRDMQPVGFGARRGQNAARALLRTDDAERAGAERGAERT